MTSRMNDKKQRTLMRTLLLESQDGDHPSLMEDWPTLDFGPKASHFCGMPSVEASKHWFGSVDPSIIKQAGYVFRVYEVPDEDVVVGRSRQQVFFKREREQLVEEKESLDALEKAA